MKKFKRTIAAGLTVTMMGTMVLTGCGQGSSSDGTSGNDADPSKNTAEQTVEDQTNSEQAAAGQTDTQQTATEFTEVSLPLTEEKQTLKIFTKNDVAMMNACGGDLNNTPFYKELEERTNVHIEWIVPASGSEREQFNLMLSSGELADLMFISPTGLNYPDGLDAAIDDGYFLDLTDLLPKYAPNYLAAIEASSDEVKRGVVTDSKRYGMMYSIRHYEQPPFFGYVIRQDWLDELGLEAPVTYDDWENMLTKFKEEKGASAPFSTTAFLIWGLGAGMGAYGDTNNNFYQIDGTVYNSLTDNSENVKEYLTMLNRWYEKGLIDPDFASAPLSSYFGDSVLVTTNSTGAFSTMYTLPSSLFLPSMEEGASFTAVLPPVKNKGDEIKYRGGSRVNPMEDGWAISADCENPELAIRWVDYLYSEAGALFANYGVEGETYTLNENGEPIYTDIMLKNPDGLSFDECQRVYTLAPGFPAGYTDYTRDLQGVPEENCKMMDKWSEIGKDYDYPTYATMTAEENQEYSDLYTDIDTYIDENVLSFITGAKSLDEFDAFIETIKGMGIERCKEIKQSALDRYNAR